MKLDRTKFEWKSVNGPVKVCDMEDSHLLNVIGFLEERAELYPYYAKPQQRYLDLFKEEVELRGLSFFYTLKRLKLMPWQCAHIDPNDGTKKRWDWNKGVVKV